jgi:hypothetical protein
VGAWARGYYYASPRHRKEGDMYIGIGTLLLIILLVIILT